MGFCLSLTSTKLRTKPYISLLKSKTKHKNTYLEECICRANIFIYLNYLMSEKIHTIVNVWISTLGVRSCTLIYFYFLLKFQRKGCSLSGCLCSAIAISLKLYISPLHLSDLKLLSANWTLLKLQMYLIFT